MSGEQKQSNEQHSEAQQKEAHRQGMGDWRNFSLPTEQLLETARCWSQQLEGISKPWLCWNVDADWCLIQQKLIKEIGWTPIVGGDPRAPLPKLIPEAHYIDFNKTFQFPKMMFHFPLELFFAWSTQNCKKLAFWHSDLLVKLPTLKKLAAQFEQLEDGETSAVLEKGGLRNFFNTKRHRYWELIGCTTTQASKSQFEHGSGWWKNIQFHPNCPQDEFEERSSYFYDHGTGLMYWKKKYHGRVHSIDPKLVEEGHCSFVRKKDYARNSPRDQRRDLTQELRMNFDLNFIAKKLELERFL